MTKVGRNHPCPCGSGKKYKLCCLPKEEARAAEAAPPAPSLGSAMRSLIQSVGWEADPGDAASNLVIDLVREDKLGEAEIAARQLLADSPDAADGRRQLQQAVALGMMCKVRGDREQAALHYRKALAFIESHPDEFDAGAVQLFRNWIDELERPADP
jgi:hypothetical protein